MTRDVSWWLVTFTPPTDVAGEQVKARVLATTDLEARELTLNHLPTIHSWPGPPRWMRDHRHFHATRLHDAPGARPQLVSWWQDPKTKREVPYG
jgi:hypothetical protein